MAHYQAGHSSAANTAGSTVTIDAAQSPFISNQPLKKGAANSVDSSFPFPVPHLTKYTHWALNASTSWLCLQVDGEARASAGLA